MTESVRARPSSGYALASTDRGEHTHIFGRGDGPLCGRDYTADRDPVGTLCGNCKALADVLGLSVGATGGESA